MPGQRGPAGSRSRSMLREWLVVGRMRSKRFKYSLAVLRLRIDLVPEKDHRNSADIEMPALCDQSDAERKDRATEKGR